MKFSEREKFKLRRECDVYGLPADAPDLLKFLCYGARETFTGSGSHMPMLFVVKDGQLEVIGAQVTTVATKDIIAN